MLLNALKEGDLEGNSGGLPFPPVIEELLRPASKRLKRLPVRNRYFLDQEAEVGDPLCYKDPDDLTTDTEDHRDEAWDEDESDEEFDPNEEVEDYEMVQHNHRMSP
jgi:hypothetical protein